MVVKRGEVWIVNFNPGFGTELHKNRPALLISANQINQHHPRVIVIPISTKNYSGPHVVKIISKNAGLDRQSLVLPVEIRAVDKKRLIKKIGMLSKTEIKEAEEALKLVLGMIELD